LIDLLAFIPPSELAPNAATETTLAALKSKVDGTLSIDKAGLATTTGQAAIVQAIADKPIADVSALAKDATLGQLKTSLDLQAKLTDSQPVNLQIGGSAIATNAGAANAQTLRVVQSSDDILRLRSLTPRKPAAVTLTTTTAIDLIAAPSNPAHRHVICWICGQNATATVTVAEFTGGAVPIKIVTDGRATGRDFSVDPQIMTLPAGAAFRVGQSVATTFEASCGYYTIDATGAPV
jgi:hypothetical protein